MTLKDQVQADMSAAMKAREQLRLDTLRMVKSAIRNREVAEIRELSETEVLQVLRSLIKQRRDSVEQFQKAGRTELAEKESAEIAIIEAYLPPELSVEELKRVVDEVIGELGHPSIQQMGLVMKTVMARLSGQAADGKRVSDLVRARLQDSEKPT